MTLRDLFVEIGVDVNDNPLSSLDEQIDDVVDQFEELEKSSKSADDEIDKLGDNRGLDKLDKEVQKADKGMSVFKKTVLSIGSALMAWGIANAVKDFTVGAIEAAASANALNSQFDQVFDELSETATSNMNAIAEETGILPSRLKSSFTQMAAFAKTTGVDTASALSLTERATKAAADSAAFYDKSIEDVTDSLQSFLKGNYENDSALGISATETTRNAKANELYGQSFKDLDEAQKQLTLLAMVEEGNELSGALGQAARESETFENQLGNLKQAWEDFLAKAGAPILEQSVGVLSWLSDVLSNIDPTPFMTGVSGMFTALEKFGKTLGDTFNTLKSGDISKVWESLGIPPGIAETIERYAETVWDNFTFAGEVIMEFLDEVIFPMVDTLIEEFGPIVEDVFGTFVDTFGIVSDVVKQVIENVVVPLFPVISDVVSTVFDVASPILDLLATAFEGISDAVSWLVENIIEPLFPTIAPIIETAWSIAGPILGFFAEAFEAIAKAAEWVVDAVGEAMDALEEFNPLREENRDKLILTPNMGVNVLNSMPGFDTGIGRVPFDDMPAFLHKDEAVLPADEAEKLRNIGILQGDGRYPTLDFGGANDYVSSSTVTTNNSSTTIQAPVTIIVQGGNTNEETTNSIKEGIEEFFADLNIIIQTPREG